MTALIALTVPALIGALVGILTTSWKTRKDLESAYDIALRQHRITAYGELWKALEPLAAYAAPVLTRASAAAVSSALTGWYFQIGGVFLSARTREPYFELQRGLTGAVAATPPGEPLGADLAEVLRALASRLRTATTDDIASRAGSRLDAAGSGVVRRLRPGRVTATLDRGWRWDPPRSCYLVRVVNGTDAEVTVSAIRVGPVAAVGARALPVRLQPGEPLEASAPAAEVGAPARATVTLADRRTVRARTASRVPLPGGVLDRPLPGSNRPAGEE